MKQTITPEQRFHSQINENVRLLEKARNRINTEINSYLRKDDMPSVRLFTYIYALLYFSWIEASLVKLVHTPNGFTPAEKIIILDNRDIIIKWKQCIDTAFEKFRHFDLSIPDKKIRIHQLVDDFFNTQAKIRNKIAHGQWVNPLFSNNLSIDSEMRIYMDLIDIIQIDLWFEVSKEIILIVNGLIDARVHNSFMAHYEKYVDRLTAIQNLINTRSKWTMDDKKNRLRLKAFKG